VDVIGDADLLMSSGRMEQAVALYRTWLDDNPDHPQRHFICYNYAVVLLNMGDLSGSRHFFEEAIRVNPDFLPPYINLGNVLERLVSPLAAAECWQQLVNRLPELNAENIDFKTSALKQIARVLGMAEAEEALRQSLEIDPHQHDVREHWINWRQLQCKWPVMVPFGKLTKAHLMKGFAPLSLAVYTDDPLLQLSNACMYHQSEVGQPQPTFLETHGALRDHPARRPRIGYLSSDLRVHAIGFLMVELFELHNRERVEIFLYSTGPQFDDHINRRIRDAAEHWRDISGLSDEDAARQMVADGIEILIDINGYTNSARTRMLAMRPAPVIVNWLGYPGTMGSPYHNYIIADDFIIPPGHEIFYSEAVLRLPCYQPNDRKRFVAPHRPTRQEVGLPEEAMVYCCFNGVKKITAFTWHLWIRILQQAPGSVLWLLFEVDAARDHLLAIAAQHGIAPERVIFAPRQLNHEHMARYPLVDLMLDSSPYGAHTTASDALWMGVPILTMAGVAFPSRVCGSLVRSAGLPELICTTADAYVARAVELGRNREVLAGYRQRLLAQRDHCVLFDTPALAAHLEELFFRMRDALQQGELPRPDLSNLEIYQEIGIALDNEGNWFTTLDNLAKQYTDRLIEQDRLCFIRDDQRLWSSEARRRHAERKQVFVNTLLHLDDAGELEPFLQFVQGKHHDPREMLQALTVALEGRRQRAAYILAMLLANSGYRDHRISLALCLGGLRFNNPQEVARGLEEMSAQMTALPPATRRALYQELLAPDLGELVRELPVPFDRERVLSMVALLRAVVPELHAPLDLESLPPEGFVESQRRQGEERVGVERREPATSAPPPESRRVVLVTAAGSEPEAGARM
ncbi:MAG: hypothetical protein HQM02_12845, partial [Magnetococcales bacterium]|nr:hypothetical protein [Magnetococcales bacterium]